jgi:hypothetical protein
MGSFDFGLLNFDFPLFLNLRSPYIDIFATLGAMCGCVDIVFYLFLYTLSSPLVSISAIDIHTFIFAIVVLLQNEQRIPFLLINTVYRSLNEAQCQSQRAQHIRPLPRGAKNRNFVTFSKKI